MKKVAELMAVLGEVRRLIFSPPQQRCVSHIQKGWYFLADMVHSKSQRKKKYASNIIFEIQEVLASDGKTQH